jgi:hypothetical protein
MHYQSTLNNEGISQNSTPAVYIAFAFAYSIALPIIPAILKRVFATAGCSNPEELCSDKDRVFITFESF